MNPMVTIDVSDVRTGDEVELVVRGRVRAAEERTFALDDSILSVDEVVEVRRVDRPFEAGETVYWAGKPIPYVIGTILGDDALLLHDGRMSVAKLSRISRTHEH